jgi:hypothetical protein
MEEGGGMGGGEGMDAGRSDVGRVEKVVGVGGRSGGAGLCGGVVPLV